MLGVSILVISSQWGNFVTQYLDMNSCLDITNTGEKERGRREMSNVGSNNKQFLITQLMWLGISFGISITISILIPFPISLVIIIAVFIMLNLYMRKRMMQRMGMGGGGSGGIFGSIFSSSSSMFGGDTSLKYYCMSCGTQHKQATCPKCGSKMKRVGFWWWVSLDAGNQKEKCIA